MIHKTIQIHQMDSHCEIKQNLQYWLSRPPQERIAAVDALRREYYGDSQRLKRVARVLNWDEFIADQRATGRKKGRRRH